MASTAALAALAIVLAGDIAAATAANWRLVASGWGTNRFLGDFKLELIGNALRSLSNPLDQAHTWTTGSLGRNDKLPQVLGGLLKGPSHVDTRRSLDDAAIPLEVGQDEIVILENTVRQSVVVEQDLDGVGEVALKGSASVGVLQKAVDQDGIGELCFQVLVGPQDGFVDGLRIVDTESTVKVLTDKVPLVVVCGVAVHTNVGLHLPVTVPVTSKVLHNHETHEDIQLELLLNLGNGSIVSLDNTVPRLTEGFKSCDILRTLRIRDERVQARHIRGDREAGSRATIKEGTHFLWRLAIVEHGSRERVLGDIIQEVEGTYAVAIDEETNHVGLVGVSTHGSGDIGVKLLADLGGVLLHVAEFVEVAVLPGFTGGQLHVPALLGIVLLLASTVDTKGDILMKMRENNNNNNNNNN